MISGNSVSSNTITISTGDEQKADIVIRGVSIDVIRDSKASLLTKGIGAVDIELDGENILIGGENRAGLQKKNTGVLTIKDENSEEGSVTATGGKFAAGIGGGDTGAGSNITITGGNKKYKLSIKVK